MKYKDKNKRYISAKCLAAVCVYAASFVSLPTVASNDNVAPEATKAEFALSFRDTPLLAKPYLSASPTDRKDGITVGQLGKDGGDKNKIINLAKQIVENNKDKYDSLLIAQNNTLLFESYYLRGRVNLPHFQASATKAYTGFALGRAIQLGYLTMADLDKPIVTFLKDLDRKKLAKGYEHITLAKALTMRSGMRIDEAQEDALSENVKQLKKQAFLQTYLESSAPISNHSQVFKYQFDPMLIMQVIDAVVPGSAENFIKKELLDKLSITHYEWPNASSDIPRAGSGSKMTSREMLKWGVLAMNNGFYEGEQLVPEAFVKRATSRELETDPDVKIYGGGKDVSRQGYGFYWWSADLNVGDKKYFAVSAQGGGGQYILLVRELDLIVVVTAHSNDNRTLQTVAESILPAFIQ